MGIDPPSAANAPFQEGLVGGSFISADDRDGLMLGQALAEKLKVGAGQKVTLMVNTANGDLDQQLFTVRGIYTTHTPANDEAVVLLPIRKAQTFTQTEQHASILFILLKNRDQSQAVADALKSSHLKVLTWEQMNDLVVQTEQFADAYMYVLYMIVLAVTATVIINTLVMSVFERTREIGILSAMGMKSSSIMGMFFAESGLLGIGGIVIGLILGGLLVAYTSSVGIYIGNMGVTGMMLGERIYSYLTVDDAVALTVITFVITLLAALYPALLAARMEPVQALRGGK
jgi:ABC-type lipoprotein release transport system permease subunit